MPLKPETQRHPIDMAVGARTGRPPARCRWPPTLRTASAAGLTP